MRFEDDKLIVEVDELENWLNRGLRNYIMHNQNRLPKSIVIPAISNVDFLRGGGQKDNVRVEYDFSKFGVTTAEVLDGIGRIEQTAKVSLSFDEAVTKFRDAQAGMTEAIKSFRAARELLEPKLEQKTAPAVRPRLTAKGTVIKAKKKRRKSAKS